VCKVLLQVDRYWNKVLFRSFQEFVLADQVLCVNHFAGNCDSFHSRCYRKLQARSWFLSIENVSRCTWGLFWEIFGYQEVFYLFYLCGFHTPGCGRCCFGRGASVSVSPERRVALRGHDGGHGRRKAV